MISSARPIKNIHVSGFDGSRSLWFTWITHASDYIFLQKRLQMPSGNPHCIYSTQRPRNGQQCASLRQCQHCVSALFRRLAISPSRPSVGPFTPPLHRHHRTAMLSLRHARRIRSFFGPALRIRPFFLHPPLPLSLRPRAASAPFFAALPPPIRTPCKSRCTRVRFFHHAFHVLPRSPSRPLPGCLLISCSFLEASDGLRCRRPPACGGAPGAVHVCFADHCFILRTMRQI